MRVREALERTLAQQMRTAIDWMDSIAYDIGKRKEVFLDTGLGQGASVTAAVWSEIGRYRRGDSKTGWRATGTGLVVSDDKQNASFAVGVEPQILSGDKHGPAATGAEPLGQKVQRVANEAGVDAGSTTEDIEQGKEQAKQQAKEVVKETKDAAKTFQRSVEVKKKQELQRKGWESSAFDF